MPACEQRLAASRCSRPINLSPDRLQWAAVVITYLRHWTADIGGAVKAGQLLAEIDTPELDEQLVQARAELAPARSNAALAESGAGNHCWPPIRSRVRRPTRRQGPASDAIHGQCAAGQRGARAGDQEVRSAEEVG